MSNVKPNSSASEYIIENKRKLLIPTIGIEMELARKAKIYPRPTGSDSSKKRRLFKELYNYYPPVGPAKGSFYRAFAYYTRNLNDIPLDDIREAIQFYGERRLRKITEGKVVDPWPTFYAFLRERMFEKPYRDL